MKQIFTYPNYFTSNYIDPLYVGDANSGFTKRVDELLAGNYKAWEGMDPTWMTTSDTQKELSKFINYLDNIKSYDNLTMNDFWYNPVVVAYKQLIGTESISQVTYSSIDEETIFTTSTPHEFEDGMILILAGFDGEVAQYNGDTFYAKVLTTTTLQLANDAQLTDLLVIGANSVGTFDTLDWQRAQATSSQPDTDKVFKIDLNTFVPDPGNNPVLTLLDGTGVRINSVERNGTDLVSNTYYTQDQGGGIFSLYQDSALTNPLLSSEILGFEVGERLPARAQFKYNYTSQGVPIWDKATFEMSTPALLTDDEKWVNIPISQQELQFQRPFNYLYNDYLKLTIGSHYNDPSYPVVQNKINSGNPGYYRFNDYTGINILADNTLSMRFTSSSFVALKDPADINQYYQYEVLPEMHFSPAHNNPQHSVQLFRGFTFDVTASDPTWNLPQLATIINQPGKPVCDAQDGFLNFGSIAGGGDVMISGPSNFTGGLFNRIDQWNWMNFIKVAIWNPAVDPEDYRTGWDEYENLNIMSKDVDGNYTVNEYGYFDYDWPTRTPVNPDAACLIVWARYNEWATNQDAYMLYSNYDTAVYNTQQGFGSDITLEDLNAFWGTSYTSTDTIPIKLSTCPWEIVPDSLRASSSWNTQPGGLSYYWYDPASATPYKIPWNQSSSYNGIVDDVFFYPDTNAQKPTPFIAHNELTMNPLLTGDMNAEFLLEDQVISTVGNLAPDTSEPYPYEVSSVAIRLPGNQVYSYLDSNGDSQFGAKVAGAKYWPVGAENATFYSTSGETSALFTVSVDGNGRLSGVSLVEEQDAEGRYATGDQMVLPILPLSNQYTPPTPTPAEQQDDWDTDDEWTTPGFDNRKEWPRHVSPASASINLNTPTIVNNSQNGFKYTRKSAFTKWTLDVEYPPMSYDEFQEFHAIAMAAQGQAIPFYFVLENKDGDSILWGEWYNEAGTTTQPILREDYVAGDTALLLEGFSSFETDAFKRGEIFVDGENQNGNLHTVLNTVDANVFGEAKIRLPMPLRQAISTGQPVYKNPYHAVVTMTSDDFSYTVDTKGYYYMSVSFDLDGFK